MSFPEWDSMGVLPPVRLGAKGTGLGRSPYQTDMVSLVDRFATSPERKTILHGLLRFRKELHEAGLVSGIQWVDGSFLENIEALDGRSPNDIDLVTFYFMPAGQTQLTIAQTHPKAFDHARLKADHAVDAFFVELGLPTDIRQIQTITYWYSLWSHRRNGSWKGFLQVDLDPKQDAEARTILDESIGGTP